jgi:hypothetical protein
MRELLEAIVGALLAGLRPRAGLVAENLALRQQLGPAAPSVPASATSGRPSVLGRALADLQGHRRAVHAEETAAPGATAADDVGHVPPDAPRRDARRRLSDGAYGHLRRLVRVLRPVARAPTHPPCQRHGPPACRVDCSAGRRSRRPRRRCCATDPRPRPHLRVGVRRA